ncbi:MAG: cell division FtsA domain-containing protein [Alphaproteobacteria bacterium]
MPMAFKKNRFLSSANIFKDGWRGFSQNFDNEPFGVLSLGSETIRLAIFRRDKNNAPLLMGIGMATSLGIKNGFITDLKACRSRVFLALSQAEKMAEYNLKKIALLFSGTKPVVVMKKYNLTLGGAAITRRHLFGLHQRFWSPKIVGDYHLLYPIPFEYRLDQSPSIKNPLGLVGQNLSLTMAMIYEDRHALENVDSFLDNMKLPPSLLMDEAMAVALGMTSVEEQDTGALSIHIGADTTNVAVIKNFCPIFLYRFNVGGRSLTRELAKTLRLDIKTAEAVKRNLPDMTGYHASIPPNPLLPNIDNDKAMVVVRAHLSKFINHIVGILEKNRIQYQNLSVLAISGGGAKLRGLDRLLAEKLHKRVHTTPATNLANLPRYVHGTEIAGLTGVALFIIKKQLNQQQQNTSHMDFYQFLPKPSLWRNIIAWAKKNYG